MASGPYRSAPVLGHPLGRDFGSEMNSTTIELLELAWSVCFGRRYQLRPTEARRRRLHRAGAWRPRRSR